VDYCFPFVLNSGRHLLQTRLAEAGIDPAAIDYGLGHQRLWREALNRFSAAALPVLEQRFAAGADAILKAAGLAKLSDLPAVPRRRDR
jgi:hypothetical protein